MQRPGFAAEKKFLGNLCFFLGCGMHFFLWSWSTWKKHFIKADSHQIWTKTYLNFLLLFICFPTFLIHFKRKIFDQSCSGSPLASSTRKKCPKTPSKLGLFWRFKRTLPLKVFSAILFSQDRPKSEISQSQVATGLIFHSNVKSRHPWPCWSGRLP